MCGAMLGVRQNEPGDIAVALLRIVEDEKASFIGGPRGSVLMTVEESRPQPA